MASELARAYVQIVPTAQGIKQSLTDELDGAGSSAGKSSGLKIGAAIKKAIVAAGIGEALKQALNEGAALEQSLGGIETLFKDSADTVIANAKNAYQTAGMSANAYMESVTGFSASLLQGLGGDTAKAAQIADMALTDMSDNANKMGTSMELIQNAYQGFAKQNYTMLDNLKLGYGGTRTEMERLLADAQKLTGVKYDINNLSDVYSAIHAIQGEMEISGRTAEEVAEIAKNTGREVNEQLGTTAKEAATTFSGSLASMKAAYSNLLGNLMLGEDLSASLSALGETVITFVSGNLLPALSNIISALPELLISLVTELIPVLISSGAEMIYGIVEGLVSGIPDFLASISDMINSATEYLQGDGLTAMFESGFDMLLNLIMGFVEALPDFISAVYNLVTSFLDMIMKNLPNILRAGVQMILNLVNGIVSNIPQIVSAVLQGVTALLTTITQNLPQILQAGIEIIGELVVGLINAIPQIIAAVPQIVSGLWDTITSVDWLELGCNIVEGIANGIANAASAIWNALKNAVAAAWDSVLSYLGIHSPSTEYAWIGEMLDEGLALGISDNTDSITSAVKDVAKLTGDSFDAQVTVRAAGTQEQLLAQPATAQESKEPYEEWGDRFLDRMEELIYIVANQNVRLMVGERDLGRILRDMGVVFA